MSKRSGHAIAPTTAANLTAGTTQPQQRSLVGFLHGCGLPTEAHRSWLSAHRRLFPRSGAARASTQPSAVQPAAAAKAMVISGRGWRLVPVTGFRPEHASIHGAGLEPGTARLGPTQPDYVIRDHDAALRTQLQTTAAAGGLVVLAGRSATGKSRSLYEAVREVYRGWHVLLVDDAAAVREAAPRLPGRTVVWLDDTPSVRYLTPGGLTRVDVMSLIDPAGRDGPVVVVDMLWPAAYHHLTTRPRPVPDEEGLVSDPWRDAREVLALAERPVTAVADRLTGLSGNAPPRPRIPVATTCFRRRWPTSGMA